MEFLVPKRSMDYIFGRKSKQEQLIRRTRLFRTQLAIFCALHRPVGCSKYYHFILYLLILLPCVVINIFDESVEDSLKRKFEEHKLIQNFTHYIMQLFDMLLIPILSIELFLRFWSSSCIFNYKGMNGKYKYVKKHFLARILDVLGIITFTCHLFLKFDHQSGYNITIRILLFIQVMQISRFQIRALKLASNTIQDQFNQLCIAFSIATLSLLFASFLMYLFEKDINKEITNIFDSFYWGFITLSTVGYGDVVPVTKIGKIFTCLCVIIGVGTFALPSAILGTGLAIRVQEKKRINIIKNPAAKLIQSIWRCYAATNQSNSIATWKMYKKTNGTYLTELDKEVIRYIRFVKYLVAKRLFKMVTKTLNSTDMFEVYTTTNAQLTKRIHHIVTKVNNLSITIGTKYQLKKEIKNIREMLDEIKQHLNIDQESSIAKQLILSPLTIDSNIPEIHKPIGLVINESMQSSGTTENQNLSDIQSDTQSKIESVPHIKRDTQQQIQHKILNIT